MLYIVFHRLRQAKFDIGECLSDFFAATPVASKNRTCFKSGPNINSWHTLQVMERTKSLYLNIAAFHNLNANKISYENFVYQSIEL